MSTSQKNGNPLLLKIVIVVFVFPTIAYLTSILLGFLGAGLLLLLPGSWLQGGLTIYQIVSTCIAFLGGFLVSRWIWPREPSSSSSTPPTSTSTAP